MPLTPRHYATLRREFLTRVACSHLGPRSLIGYNHDRFFFNKGNTKMICRVCDSTELELAVDLGSQPWCNHFLREEEVGSEPMYPLRVVYCRQCATVQLDYTVKKEIMFGDHTYLSGVTRSLSEHFRKIASEVDQRFADPGQKSRAVLDIGSNDGTQLKHFQALGYDVLGVESSKRTAQIANEAGVTTLNEFFNLELVEQPGPEVRRGQRLRRVLSP